MSARKTRPALGTTVAAGMSQRDIAAALGTTTAWLNRCMRLAAIPKDQFEDRLALNDAAITKGSEAAYRFLAARDTPVPARGRVARALAIYRTMNDNEREVFLAQIGGTP